MNQDLTINKSSLLQCNYPPEFYGIITPHVKTIIIIIVNEVRCHKLDIFYLSRMLCTQVIVHGNIHRCTTAVAYASFAFVSMWFMSIIG